MKNKSIIVKAMINFTLLSSIINASKISSKTESFGEFYVEAHFPENQYSKNAGYYDLMMEANQKQTISFDIAN